MQRKRHPPDFKTKVALEALTCWESVLVSLGMLNPHADELSQTNKIAIIC